jgi:hypothetical protein
MRGNSWARFYFFYSFDCGDWEEKLERPESQNDRKAETNEKLERPRKPERQE